ASSLRSPCTDAVTAPGIRVARESADPGRHLRVPCRGRRGAASADSAGAPSNRWKERMQWQTGTGGATMTDHVAGKKIVTVAAVSRMAAITEAARGAKPTAVSR